MCAGAIYWSGIGRVVFGLTERRLKTMTGDHAEAQDAVQEAFVRAWAHRGKLDRLGAPEAWVRSAAWHIAVSRWNRARLGRLLTRAPSRPLAVDGPSPDHVALIEALRKLPAEQRRALVLYHLCDLTVAQIAGETGAAAGTAFAGEVAPMPSRVAGA